VEKLAAKDRSGVGWVTENKNAVALGNTATGKIRGTRDKEIRGTRKPVKSQKVTNDRNLVFSVKISHR
jgi:hypothetical protein